MRYTETENEKLDYSKPIYATSEEGTTYLLVPSNEDRSYRFRDYDWLNLSTGKYNSCRNFQTVEDAIKHYPNAKNCTISLT